MDLIGPSPGSTYCITQLLRAVRLYKINTSTLNVKQLLVQFIVLSNYRPTGPETCRELEFYITAILIKLYAFVYLNCVICIVMQGTENVKLYFL